MGKSYRLDLVMLTYEMHGPLAEMVTAENLTIVANHDVQYP